MASFQNRHFEAPKAEEVRQRIASVLSQLSPRNEPESLANGALLQQSGSPIQDILNQKRQAFERRLRNPNEPNQTIFISNKVVEFSKNLEERETTIRTLTQERSLLVQELHNLREELSRWRSGAVGGLQVQSAVDQSLQIRVRELEAQLTQARQEIQAAAARQEASQDQANARGASEQVLINRVRELEARLVQAEQQAQVSKAPTRNPLEDPAVQARIRELESVRDRLTQEHQTILRRQQEESLDYRRKTEDQLRELNTALLSGAKKDVDNILISKLRSLESQLQIQDNDLKTKMRVHEQTLSQERSKAVELERARAQYQALFQQRENDIKNMEQQLILSADRIRELEQRVSSGHGFQSHREVVVGGRAEEIGLGDHHPDVQKAINEALQKQAEQLSRRHLDEVLGLQRKNEELRRAHAALPVESHPDEVAQLKKRVQELEGNLSSASTYQAYAHSQIIGGEHTDDKTEAKAEAKDKGDLNEGVSKLQKTIDDLKKAQTTAAAEFETRLAKSLEDAKRDKAEALAKQATLACNVHADEIVKLQKQIADLQKEAGAHSNKGKNLSIQSQGSVNIEGQKKEVQGGESHGVSLLLSEIQKVADELKQVGAGKAVHQELEIQDLKTAEEKLNQAEIAWMSDPSNAELEAAAKKLQRNVRILLKREGKSVPPNIAEGEDSPQKASKLWKELKSKVKQVAAAMETEVQVPVDPKYKEAKEKVKAAQAALEKEPENQTHKEAAEKAKAELAALGKPAKKSKKVDEGDEVRKAEKVVHELVLALEKEPKNSDLEKQLREAQAEVERQRARADEKQVHPEIRLKNAEEAVKLAREAVTQKPDNADLQKGLEDAERQLRRAHAHHLALVQGVEWSHEDDEDLNKKLKKAFKKLEKIGKKYQAKSKKVNKLQKKLDKYYVENQHPLLQPTGPRKATVKVAGFPGNEYAELEAKFQEESLKAKKEIEVRDWQIQDLGAQLDTMLLATRNFDRTKIELEEQLTKVTQERDALKQTQTETETKFAAEMTAKQTTIQELTTKLTEVQKSSAETSKNLADTLAKLAPLEIERQKLRTELEALKKLVSELTDHSNKTVKNFNEKAAELNQMESKLAASDKAVEDLKKRLQTQEEESSKRLAQLIQSANEKGAKEASELNQKFLDDLNNENSKLKIALRELETAMGAKDRDLEQADAAFKKQADEIANMKEFVKTIEEKTALLESELTDNVRILDKSLVEKKDLEKKMDEATKAREKAEAALKAAEEAAKKHGDDLGALKAEVEARNAEIRKLVDRAEGDKKELDRLQAAVKAAESQKTALESTIAAFKKLEDDSARKITDLTERLKKAEEGAAEKLTEAITAKANDRQLAEKENEAKELRHLVAQYEEALMEAAAEIHGIIAQLPQASDDLKRKATERIIASSPQLSKELRTVMREMIDALRKDSEMTTQALREEHGILSNDVTELKKELEKRHEENNYLRKLVESHKEAKKEPTVSEEVRPDGSAELEELRELLVAKEEEIETLRQEVTMFGQKFEEINSEYMEKLRVIVEPLKADEQFGEDIERIEQMFEEIAGSYPEGVSSEEFGYVLMNLKMGINEFFTRYVAEAGKEKRKGRASGGTDEEGEEETPEQKIEALTNMVMELEQNKNELITEVEARDERIQELEENLQQLTGQAEEIAEQLEEYRKENEEMTEQLNSRKPVKQVEAEAKLKKEITFLKTELKTAKKQKDEIEKAAAELEEELQKKEEEIENIKNEVATAFEEEQNNFNEKLAEQEEIIQKLTDDLAKAQASHGGRGGRSKESFTQADEGLKRQLTEAQEEIKRLHTEKEDDDKKVSKAERGYDHLREKYEKLQAAYKQLKAGSALATENKELKEKLAATESIQKEVEALKVQLDKARKHYENEHGRVIQLEKEKESRLQDFLNQPDVSGELRKELMYKNEELKGREADLMEYRRMVESHQKDLERFEEENEKLKDGLTRRNRIIKKLRASVGMDSVARDSELASELDVSSNLDDFDLGHVGKDSITESQVFLRSEREVKSKAQAEQHRAAQANRQDKGSSLKQSDVKLSQSDAIKRRR